MFYKLKTYSSIPLMMGSILVMSACHSGENKKTAEVSVDSAELAKDIFSDISKAKQIFYSLPSPLESAMLIKSAGATYNEKLLNPLSNVSKYTSNKSMALNLGSYITDLSYASMFDQSQTTLKYMEVAKKMADGLGITDAIDENTIKKLEDNINNREEILNIISETFMSSTAFLQENDRQPLAAIALTGGWIEGLYLSSRLVGDGPLTGNKIVNRIVDQKLSLDIVIKLLENSKTNKDVAEILPQINNLKKVYDKIIIKTSETKTVEDPKTKTTTLKSTTSSNISQPLFDELKESVNNIRTNFTL